MELISIAGQLMPGGKAKFLEVVQYPMIRQLIETEGKKKMLAVLVLLVKDFCSSMNVARNMNEDQMIEAAAMMLDECGNFRMEDYVMMFQMAKRGQLVENLYQSIDIQTISKLMDEYWLRRKNVAEVMMETEYEHFDSIGQGSERTNGKPIVWDEKKGYIEQPKELEKFQSQVEHQRLKEIEERDTASILEKQQQTIKHDDDNF